MSLTFPVALRVIVINLLGMATGGFLLTLLWGWLREATRKQRRSG